MFNCQFLCKVAGKNWSESDDNNVVFVSRELAGKVKEHLAFSVICCECMAEIRSTIY